jgi:hypothetical protein
LGRQNIAFQGHDESVSSLNRGNYLEFLQFRSRECTELATHLSGSGKNIQTHILQEIKSASLFSLICDETMDIARIEQFSLCVRYVTPDLVVKERFLGCQEYRWRVTFRTFNFNIPKFGVECD